MVATAASRAPDAGHERRRIPLAVHLLAASTLVVLIALRADLGASWTSDDGAYAVQVAALEDGSWAFDYAGAEIDPEGQHFPFLNATTADGRYFPYAKHPAWILLLRASTLLFGRDFGLHVPSIAGAIGAVVTAGLLARRLGSRAAPLAAWLVACGPVLVHASGLWAHAPSAAVSGAACLVLSRIVEAGPTLRRSLLLGSTLAAGALLRSEGLLFGAAVLAVLALRGRVWRHDGGRSPVLVLVPAGAMLAAAHLWQIAWRLELIPTIDGVVGSRLHGVGWLAGRLPGAWRSLLRAAPSDVAPSVLGLMGVVLLVVAVVQLRRSTPPREGPLLFGAAGAIALAARGVLAPGVVLPGLASAWPLAVAGLVAWPRRDGDPVERALVALMAVFAVLVCATQYPGGGGLEWGGRFFSPILVPLAVVAAAGIERLAIRLRNEPRAVRRSAAAIAVIAGLVPGAVGVLSTEAGRRRHEEIVAAAIAPGSPVVVSLYPHLPRIAWRTVGDVEWYRADGSSIAGLLIDLRRTRATSVTVAGPGADDLAVDGYRREVRSEALSVLHPL